MIKATNISGLKQVKDILESLKPQNKMIDLLPEDSIEYELQTEKVGEQLCEIDAFIIGIENINDQNLINSDLRMMAYWSYLKDEISFDQLLKSLKEDCVS